MKKEKEETKPQEGVVTAQLISEVMIDPDLIIGYESGAISIFKLKLAENKEGQCVLTPIKFFSAMKYIQDLKVKHVLSFGSIQVSETDFKLAIGYYSSMIQTIKFTDSYDPNSYIMLDQQLSDVAYHEKPGINCI